MGGADPVEGLTFSLQLSADGAAKLRERVKEKLKELMGDYTDETLVEYIIVLLKNGRTKEDAEKELDVFLGDDSDSFVSWLWDHLGSNLNLYVQPVESVPDDSTKGKPFTKNHGGRDDSQNLDSGSDRGKSSKSSRSRHNREWRSLVRDTDEPPPFQSTAIPPARTDDRIQRKVGRGRRSPSPQALAQKKRNRPDEQQQSKRVASQATINVPRRLLQFAVRDAVATARTPTSTSEPASKRLRSVVSTSAGDSPADVRPRIRSVARLPNAMTTAIKAVEEAAKDVVRNKASSNVFDRLGRGRPDQLSDAREDSIEDVDYGVSNRISEDAYSNYPVRSDYIGEYTTDATLFETEPGAASDSASDIEGYDDVNIAGRRVVGAPPVSASDANEGQESMTVQYSVAKNANENLRNSWKDQDQTAAASSTSRKIVNISVNVNTWKPTQYQESRELSEMESRKTVPETEAVLPKPGAWPIKDSINPVTTSNGNGKPVADTQKDSQKAVPTVPVPYSTGRPTEDADSRTIFVNNVHFAATKDSLSRHFNKFGDVLKVIIVTDAATGHPKGSAYVEFMRKEAAENALSLDGTSFMSRIVKVVRKSAAHPEAVPVMTWPRAMRGSPFAASRFPRVAFPRGIHSGGYRGRPPIRSGARSMQWKRDAQPTPSPADSNTAAPTVPPSVGRGLTYVRVEPKTNGSSSTA